ncbi:MAG: hypothetical protein LH613_10705 [Chamaesiphon sp.]|nr:hypothetical protein [Chamaesiphon sp.]
MSKIDRPKHRQQNTPILLESPAPNNSKKDTAIYYGVYPSKIFTEY